MGSEATAAAVGQAAIRRDPMAMLPFCGYNMAEYWKHWLEIGKRVSNPPLIFRVNWFRKDDSGKFMWPGFGENMRVLKWIVDRVRGRSGGAESPFGYMPRRDDIVWEGLDYPADDFHELMKIERQAGLAEAEGQSDLFNKFTNLPDQMNSQRKKLVERLEAAPEVWELERND